MKITVFTGNQPRHIALVKRLAALSDNLFAVLEGNDAQDLSKKSPVMRDYFSHVNAAEQKYFGDGSSLPANVQSLSIKKGDLNNLNREQLSGTQKSDFYIVFGASYIKGWLVDFLVEQGALNLHMGVSPYYRGSACNFWALYDERPEYVGATIHLLSKGLDSGPMLYHALPKLKDETPFEFTMKAVDVAQQSLLERIKSGEIKKFEPVNQDKKLQIRYSKSADFNDDTAADYFTKSITTKTLQERLKSAKAPGFLRPFYN